MPSGTHEEHSSCDVVRRELDACIRQSRGCHLLCLFNRKRGLLLQDSVNYLLMHHNGALAGELLTINLREHLAHSVLPRLGGHTATAYAAEQRGLRAAHIITVYAAGRYGLDNVNINILCFVHDLFASFRFYMCIVQKTYSLLLSGMR